MVRYKRGRRGYRRNSTRSIMMKFQSFMDISTNDSSMQIITISAGGREVLKRLAPQFGAYKYYRLGNIAVKLVPASTLPVDPSGLSYEVGEPGVDPRDQLTPGMMRITNGEDIFEDLSGLTDEQQHAIYNNMLLDPRWFKWMLQTGVKRHATPRYWMIGQLHQDKWPGAIVNYPYFTVNGGTSTFVSTATDTVNVSTVSGDTQQYHNIVTGNSDPRGFFQVGHSGRLGWLPTDELQRINTNLGNQEYAFVASPPEVEVMKIILPKAYKTRYYYRMFVTETVYFKEPIVNFGIGDVEGYEYRPLDIFHTVSKPNPQIPTIPDSGTFPLDRDTGGNYGDD